jgi:hypothetical protein
MTLDRRAAIAAYKERKSVAGVFALRCAATGEVFVGATPNIDKAFNRLRFSLSAGAHARPRLQAAWTAHGEAAFAFEALERLPEAPSAYIRDAALKERRAVWLEKLAASPA